MKRWNSLKRKFKENYSIEYFVFAVQRCSGGVHREDQPGGDPATSKLASTCKSPSVTLTMVNYGLEGDHHYILTLTSLMTKCIE